MHPDHRALLSEMERLGRPGHHDQAYVGSAHPLLGVSVPDQRRLARQWLKEHGDASANDVLALADSLFRGSSQTEKTFAAILIAASKARSQVEPEQVDAWLDHLHGWAEVDSLCQNVIPVERTLAQWPEWERLVTKLAADPNINRRRASLVLMTGPVRCSDDPRPVAAALRNLDTLKAERDVLITKAVSWLLRAMLNPHRAAALAYVEANRAALPAVAVREFIRKAETGRK